MTFYELMNNMAFVWFLYVLMVVNTLLFIIYAVSKEGRDEHGRAILGTACFYGAIALFVFMNITSYYMYHVIENIIIFANTLRLMYNGFLMVVLISIAILRKVK